MTPHPIVRKSRAQHLVFATAIMLVGSTLALGVVVFMNELAESPEKKDITSATAIEVAAAPPPKPPQRVDRPRPKPKTSPRTPPAPSLAALTGGLAGISVDIPGLDLSNVGAGADELLATEDEVTHTGDTVDQPPRPVHREAMPYPSRLRDKGVEGYVVLSIVVTPVGGVEQAKVIESKPPGVFDEVALGAIRTWRFDPAKYKGAPVRTRVRQRISFDLRRS